EDFLRQRGLDLWSKDSPNARNVRALAYKSHKSYTTYKPYIESENPETAANTLICLIHQENFLLDQLKRKLEKDFLEKGGFTERLYTARRKARNQ
ncbi:four helix bundle suffix domain-containing protein, partial [Patescibacteria group bacterium]|nr:four helix bundle suffix domain-containing protein [Patescibacteria group bacterium]